MQQIPFIDLFKSAPHVSGDKLAHHQEHFLTIYTFWYNAPILSSENENEDKGGKKKHKSGQLMPTRKLLGRRLK